MNKVKKILTYIMLCALNLSLIGCGQANYKNYVKSILDANYHGETSDYLKNTTGKSSEAKVLIEGNAKTLAENLINYYSLTLNIESETGERFIEVCKEILKNTKYEVSSAYKESNATYVDVTVYPSNILNQSDEAIKAYIEKVNDKIKAGDYNDYEKAEYQEEFVGGLLDIIASSASKTEYLDPVIITVEIDITEDNFSMSPDTLAEIEKALIKTEQ